MPPVAGACRAQLDRILASPDFQATDRDRRFLAHVVDEALAGRSDRIKAYSIALEVFGRDASFDPQSDPIVRVEAGHLRRALDRYYLGAGSADPIEITIPKGGYVPLFAWRPATIPPEEPVEAPAAAPPPRARPPLWRWVAAVAAVLVIAGAGVLALQSGRQRPTGPDIPRLLVEPFDDLSRTEASAAIARGLTQEVVGQISKFKDIVVVGAVAGDAPQPRSGNGTAQRYLLTGSIDIDPDAVRLQARVVQRSDGAVLWANSYSGNLKVCQLREIEADIAQQVATTLAQPYGVIFQADAARHVEDPPDDWRAYACTLSYYAYRANLEGATYPRVRICLEEAVARFPGYATAWALLSQTYIDEIRFRFAPPPSTEPATVERAAAAARRAVELDPTNTRGLQAEMFALSFAGDTDAALSVGKAALALNPNDSELMGEYGYRLALAGDWPAGCPLVSEARDRNPGPLGYYETALALCAYIEADYARAVTWLKKTGMPDNPNYHLIAAAVFAENGDTAAAAAEAAWLRRNAPDVAANPEVVVTKRIARQEDVERMLASLRKAGLSGTPG